MTRRTTQRIGNGISVAGVLVSVMASVMLLVGPASAATAIDPTTPTSTVTATATATATPTETATTTPDPTTTATATATAPPTETATSSPSDAGTTGSTPTAEPTYPASTATAAPGAIGTGTPTGSGSGTVLRWADSHPDTSDPNYGDFAHLAVSVDQTTDIVNQGINVSWTGGTATSPGDNAHDYMQIMQCWGDETAGPTPQQCEWGAVSSSLGNLMGANTGTRDLVRDEDPTQDYSGDLLEPAPITNPNQKSYSVPFTTVAGKTTFDPSTYFDATTTNEISAARTGADGSGQAVFETQTSLEAPQLGCGAAVGATAESAAHPRACWLVVVPRGSYNADGTTYSDNSDSRLSGSPFSASNWKDRLVVKLSFSAVATSCSIGQEERRTEGSELVARAVTTWQAKLCDSGTTYGYSEIGDGQARTDIMAGDKGAAGLAFVSDPVADKDAKDSTLVYAPVTQSSIVVGYNIDYSLRSDSPLYGKNGTPVTSLVLDARLVAKLLTQSYRYDTPGLAAGVEKLAGNPLSLVDDPEFRTLNPDFADFTSLSRPDGLMVALGNSDASARVWQWLRADPQASAFLAGTADEFGMVVNPAYQALGLATDTTADSYPKADLTYYRQSEAVPAPGYGTLDMRPYMADMDQAAYQTLKGDANVKTIWDSTKAVPAFVSGGAQVPGQRFEISITDATSAVRYGLRTAKLVNAANQTIESTPASVTAAIAAQTESSTKGVVVPADDTRTLNAYPLAVVDYAVVNVCNVSSEALDDYATLLDYAAGKGQVPGDALGKLPQGYVPLTAAMVTQTKAAADALRDPKTVAPCSPKKDEHPKPNAGASGGGSSGVPSSAGTAVSAPAAGSTSTDPDTGTGAGTAATALQKTPGTSAVGAKAPMLLALAGGLPATLVGPFLRRRGRKLARITL